MAASPSPSTTRRSLFARLPLVATIATGISLLAALASWQWYARQPVTHVPWKLPIVMSLVTLGCGAVALVACRRANRVLLFLLDFVAVLVAAWLFNHLYEQVAVTRSLLLR